MLADFFIAHIFEGDGITNGFTGGLNWKQLFGITYAVLLAINSTDGYSPVIWVRIGQFWNVVSIFPAVVLLANIEDVFYLGFEIGKIRHDEIFSQNFFNNTLMSLYDIEKKFFCKFLW